MVQPFVILVHVDKVGRVKRNVLLMDSFFYLELNLLNQSL